MNGKAKILLAGALFLLFPLTEQAAGQSLTSITVEPADPVIKLGQTQLFRATGSFDDDTTRLLNRTTPLDAGATHSCVLLLDHTVSCWGHNGFGQLGNGSTVSSSRPVPVIGISDAMAIAVGYDHACALISDGTVKCWGHNEAGQLGIGTSSGPELCSGTFPCSMTPVTVAGITSATAIAAGGVHSCAVLSGGTVSCWGDNGLGQLGTGYNSGPELCGGYYPCSTTPVPVNGLVSASTVSAGNVHTCALLSDATMRCWGDNRSGQLGNGTNSDSSIPVVVSGVSTAVSISAGNYHTCAVLLSGDVKCWGWNLTGQLGDGTTDNSWMPVTVSGISSVAQVSAGGYHTCAILSNETINCWGDNFYGQLGDGSSTRSFSPVQVIGLTGAGVVTGGLEYTCAILSNGTVNCWGYNSFGQLGNGAVAISTTPVQAADLVSVTDLGPGNDHTCGIDAGGNLKCWGGVFYGTLGDGLTKESFAPVTVTGISASADVDADFGHTCAALSDGTVRCWGYNFSGGLGNGTTADSDIPVQVTGISTATAVAVGGYHSCALLSDGTINCWGGNGSGELGNGTTTGPELCNGVVPCSTAPVAVGEIDSAIAISAGVQHTCALLSDGTVKCWGWGGFGQLGDGTAGYSSTPVAVTGMTSAVAISAGWVHSCAVLSIGTAWCWGDNSSGQLGNGTNTGPDWCGIPCSMTPVAVGGISDAVKIGAGWQHTCSVQSNGTIKCWGYNDAGQLGNGSMTDSYSPVSVSGIQGGMDIVAGGNHTCVLEFDGTVSCWGFNGYGQLGVLNHRSALTPDPVVGITTASALALNIGDLAWTSSDTGIAAIDSNGLTTGESFGTITITATLSGVSGDTTLTVRPMLTVAKFGTGSGTVTSTPSGISCGADCSEIYPLDSGVSLTAMPSASSTFSGWGGDSDCTDGSVTLDADKTCTATFTLKTYSIIASAGSKGTVTPSGTVIVNYGASQSFSMTPMPGYHVADVLVDGSSVGPNTSHTFSSVTADHSISASFAINTHELSVEKSGEGNGDVTSAPSGIDCGSDCTETFDHGTVIELTAVPDSNSTFAGWSGDDECVEGVVTLTEVTNCTATFDQKTFKLTVNLGGTGGGSVTSNPVGIDCEADCDQTYVIHTEVLLTANPDEGSVFSGWNEDCAGGLVTMTVDKSCTATFGPAGPENIPPSAPGLLSPVDGEEGLGPDVKFVWEESADPEDSQVSYEICLNAGNSNFSEDNCTPVDQTVSGLVGGVLYAGIGGSGAIMLMGMGLAGDPTRRKRILSIISMGILTGIILTACGGSDGGGNDGANSLEGMSHTILNLQADTTYYWKVIAIDQEGEIGESAVWSFATQ